MLLKKSNIALNKKHHGDSGLSSSLRHHVCVPLVCRFSQDATVPPWLPSVVTFPSFPVAAWLNAGWFPDGGWAGSSSMTGMTYLDLRYINVYLFNLLIKEKLFCEITSSWYPGRAPKDPIQRPLSKEEESFQTFKLWFLTMQ